MILVAIPTNGLRADTLEGTVEAWRRFTPEPVTVHVTTYGTTWAAGLNDAYKAHPEADIFIAGSDDMRPENDSWLPVVRESLARNESPVPLMHDPRFTIQGGVITDEEREDGAESHMTNFPVLKGEWLEQVFPLPEDLHYFSDDLIANRLHSIGVKTTYAKSFVIRHLWDERGRGAGHGSEEARMAHDKAIYRTLQR